jgi:hypothetical protein
VPRTTHTDASPSTFDTAFTFTVTWQKGATAKG